MIHVFTDNLIDLELKNYNVVKNIRIRIKMKDQEDKSI